MTFLNVAVLNGEAKQGEASKGSKYHPEKVDKDGPSYIMAAIDRVIHHCVILDMMAVDSYRAQQASHQQKAQLEEANIGTNK